jgi:hypothetical protein
MLDRYDAQVFALFATQAKSGVAVVICGEAVVEYDF